MSHPTTADQENLDRSDSEQETSDKMRALANRRWRLERERQEAFRASVKAEADLAIDPDDLERTFLAANYRRLSRAPQD